MRSPVLLAAMIPARRAVARTFPLAMSLLWIFLMVLGWRRISPRATASRCWMGLCETSTIEALPCLSKWVKSLIYLGWAWQSFHPFADDRAHLFGSLHAGLHKFWSEPWEHPDE